MPCEFRTYPGMIRAMPPLDNTDKNAPARFSGYAAMFDSWSCDLGGFRERIAPGAFSRTLESGADVRALLNHDPNYVLGRTRSGTLTLKQDERGLWFDVTAPDTGWARDLYASVQRGDIDQCSFFFIGCEDDWTIDGGVAQRTLLSLDIRDVSIVTYPAYEATAAYARSIAGDVITPAALYAAHARDEPRATPVSRSVNPTRLRLALKEKEF